jgi:hypothetical protein
MELDMCGKPNGMKPLGRPKNRWKNNIKIYVKELKYERVHWINLVHNRGQWGKVSCEHSNELPGSIKVGEFLVHLRNCYVLTIDCDPCNYLRTVL